MTEMPMMDNITNLTMEVTVLPTDSLEDLDDMDSDMDIPKTGWIIQRVILPIICAIGIFGILLTLIVLSRKSMCTSTNCYLTALAATDLLFLIILASHLQDNQFVPFSKHYYHFVIYVTYSAIFMQIFLLASVWLTVMLAVERFIGICKPFLANTLCTVTKSRIIIIGIYTFAVICRCPNFWENYIRTVNDSTSNTSLTYIEGSSLSTDKNYVVWYPWIIDGLVTSMLPFFILLVLNIRLIWEVKKSTEYLQRNQMLTQNNTSEALHREELQVTVMLISVIIVFLLCQGPYVIYTAVVSINKFVLHSYHLRVFRYITILLLAIKSAVNFVLYCWFSEKFATSLKKVFEIRKIFKLASESRNGSLISRRMSSVYSNTRETSI